MFELSMSLLDRIVFLAVGLLGLVACFSGSRLLRFWLALTGLLTGFYLGLNYGGLVLPDPVHQMVLGILIGLVLSGLYSIFPRVGSLLTGAGVMALLADQLLRIILFPQLDEYHLYIVLFFVLLGVLLGVLQVRPFLVLASAWSGGWLAAFCGGGFIAAWPLDQAAVRYDQLQGGPHALVLIGTAVLLILGAWVQFGLARRSRLAVQVDGQQPIGAEMTAVQPATLILPEREAEVQPGIETQTETEKQKDTERQTE